LSPRLSAERPAPSPPPPPPPRDALSGPGEAIPPVGCCDDGDAASALEAGAAST